MKIKAHVTQEEAIKMGYTVTAWELNQAADKLADDAAEEVQLDNYVVKLVQTTAEKGQVSAAKTPSNTLDHTCTHKRTPAPENSPTTTRTAT